jgi:drug/metabolite transporter (DMT)-like permease
VGHDAAFIAGRFLISVPIVLLFCRRRSIRPVLDRRTVLLSGAYGGAMLANLWLMLTAIKTMPISIFFPVTAGAAIVFGVVWAVMRGERPSKLTVAGALLALLAVVLINL